MNKHLLAFLPLFAACSPSGMQHPLSSSMDMQAAANHQTVTLGNKNFHLSEAKSYPLIDYWSYTLPSESKTAWTRHIDINRYKKVNAAEIYDQMQQATVNQRQTIHAANRTVCFVNEKEDGVVKEANIWRYDDVNNLTYGTGLLWHFPAGEDFNRFMNRDFITACNAMQKQRPITPPPISKP